MVVSVSVELLDSTVYIIFSFLISNRMAHHSKVNGMWACITPL